MPTQNDSQRDTQDGVTRRVTRLVTLQLTSFLSKPYYPDANHSIGWCDCQWLATTDPTSASQGLFERVLCDGCTDHFNDHLQRLLIWLKHKLSPSVFVVDWYPDNEHNDGRILVTFKTVLQIPPSVYSTFGNQNLPDINKTSQFVYSTFHQAGLSQLLEYDANFQCPGLLHVEITITSPLTILLNVEGLPTMQRITK